MDRLAIANQILDAAGERIQEEISGLLGYPLKFTAAVKEVLTREAFFSRGTKKMALSTIAVEGEAEDSIYLFALLQDAILLGGTLIMLPQGELDQRVRKEDFGSEESDAFGEIANIISGVLTAVFEELFPQKLRFRKSGLETVAPVKALQSDRPVPPGEYYCCSFSMNFDGKDLGALQILFPAALLGLAKEAPVKAQEAPPAPQPPAKAEISEPLQLLLLAEEGAEVTDFLQAAEKRGLATCRRGFQDDCRDLLQGGKIMGVFLVMREVGEQGIAAAIKVRSIGGAALPLIAAGPQWTKPAVLQAVKYGIRDILVTPASSSEIIEKIDRHLRRNRAAAG